MPRDAEQDRLAVFAQDFAKLYTRFLAEIPDPVSVTLDEFGVLFDASHLEYLHYCGGTTMDRPYYPSITEDLLLLSSSYLALPPAIAPREAQTFGLLLSFFLFSTQPTRSRGEVDASAAAAEAEPPLPPTPPAATATVTPRAAARRTTPTTAIGEGRNGSGRRAATAASAPVAPPAPSPSLCLPMRQVPVTAGCLRRVLEQLSTQLDAGANGSQVAASPRPLSTAEATAVLALRRADGWHIEPYLQQGKPVAAILAAHHAVGAPLVPSAAAPVPEQLFAASLTARTVLNAAAAPEALGGTDSVFRDPTFLELRQAYEAARRQLLES